MRHRAAGAATRHAYTALMPIEQPTTTITTTTTTTTTPPPGLTPTKRWAWYKAHPEAWEAHCEAVRAAAVARRVARTEGRRATGRAVWAARKAREAAK